MKNKLGLDKCKRMTAKNTHAFRVARQARAKLRRGEELDGRERIMLQIVDVWRSGLGREQLETYT